MLQRQAALIYVISILERYKPKIDRTYLDKLLFLIKKETEIDKKIKFYNFFPYNYGPFSNQFYFDLEYLTRQGYLGEDLKPKTEAKLGPYEKKIIDGIIDKYGIFSLKEIKNYVYKNYPEYTCKSLLRGKQKIEYKAKVFSIGYEGKDIDLFLDLIIQNHIDVVVDVRANPFSMNFAFTKKKLANYLKKVDVEYVHIPELGIRGEYRRKFKDYTKLFAFYREEILPKQISKVEELADLGKQKRIALLCFEKNKDNCHRGVLSEKLGEDGIAVEHL